MIYLLVENKSKNSRFSCIQTSFGRSRSQKGEKLTWRLLSNLTTNAFLSRHFCICSAGTNTLISWMQLKKKLLRKTQSRCQDILQMFIIMSPLNSVRFLSELTWYLKDCLSNCWLKKKGSIKLPIFIAKILNLAIYKFCNTWYNILKVRKRKELKKKGR